MRLLIFILGGLVFGFGLGLSGMTQPEVVLSFLRFEDLGLLLVMGCAVAVALPVFQLWKKPVTAPTAELFRAWISIPTVVGSILFGIGWGLAGVCPGAALASVGTGNWPVGIAVVGMFAGAYVQGLIMDRLVESGGPAGADSRSTAPPAGGEPAS